jgi:hypothetical protein
MKHPWKLSFGIVFGVLVAFSFTMFASVKPAAAANPGTIAFQGKVVNADGTNVANGTYPFVFKIYNAATSTGSTTTSCGTDTHCLWFESDSITVTAGVFQVNLGTNTSLSTIDFNAQNSLYLGITFNGDSAGEMTPRPQLQSVPYAFNSDKVGGFTASQLAQLQTGTPTAQTGALSVTGGVTSGATVQGVTVVATGALQGNTLSVNTGTFAVSAAGAITASTGITDSGGYIQSGTTANSLTGATTLSAAGTALSVTNNATVGGIFTVQSATYTTGQVVINNGQTTAPPSYPNSYVPTLTVLTNNTSSSRPLFFGYESGGAYEAYLSSGACGAFTQMCLDLGNANTDYTALQNVGTTLNIGGNGVSDDGAFSTVAIAPSGTAATTVGGTLAVAGVESLASNLAFTGTTAATITGPSNQSFTVQSAGTGALNLSSATGTLGLAAGTSTLQRITSGSSLITTLDLKDTTTANTTLQLYNSGAGVSNLQLYGGGICTGSATCTTGGTTMRLDNAGDLTNIANYTSTGGVTGGFVNDAHTETANGTFAYTEATEALGYYLSDTSYSGTAGVAPTSATTTFTVSGLPNTVDGTEAFFTINDTKPAATNGVTATVHTVVLVIGTQTIATLAGASGEGAVTETRSFIVMRMNGTWRIVGEPPTTAVANTTSTATTADYAEYIDYSGNVKPQPGDLLTVGDDPASVKQTTIAYDDDALGVVSTSPYETAGADDGHSVIIALTGRVPVNVNLQNGPIAIGDKLTASSTPGQAMKATKAGHIIGTALTAYGGSQSPAQVTVQLGVGYDDPSDGVISSDDTSDGAVQSNTGSGTVSLDTNGSTGYVDIGTTTATGVIVGRNGQTTEIKGALTVDGGSTTSGAITMNFSNGTDLQVNGDGSVTAANIVSSPSAKTATNANGLLVQQGKATSGATTGLASGLTIDNADSSLPIGSAIAITNSGGAGYGKLISTPTFTVAANGDVTNSGVFSSSNGFSFIDASGKNLVSFGATGSENLAGALNVASASVSGGLNVGGDLNIAGLSTFQKLATFLAKTVFKQDVEFDGHITVASDSAGYASLRPGESTVSVTFQQPYATVPVVNASISSGQFLLTTVTNVTNSGFDINVQAPATTATTFSWTAVAVNNPQTATNPVPAATTPPVVPQTQP